MSYDGKLLARAKSRLDEMRQAEENENSRRLGEAYRLNPRLRSLDAEISANIAGAVSRSLSGGGDPEKAMKDARDKNTALHLERAGALRSVGLPEDYTDERYRCVKCHDTGYLGTGICTCLDELYRDEQRLELSALLKLGDQTFDSFNLDWYSDVYDPALGMSPRTGMEFVYETCVEYARKFGKSSYNLFFTGGTGLGKTFLAACVARVVSESGFSVVYDMAVSVFQRFEEDRFSKGPNPENARLELRRYMTCDLLILDDLGTEMTTAFTVSALYELVNTRLCSGKNTIITSNLGVEELGRRYSPQIASRLEGEYQVLKFFGRDVRILKKELQ